jgi:acyl-[acyl carrier protein]--UDP-N-acetylglucosamine O-acyltransferase
MTNRATLGWPVDVGRPTIIRGLGPLHPCLRIGTYAVACGYSGTRQGPPPYVTTRGAPATLVGLNPIGVRRNGVFDEALPGLKKVGRLLRLRDMSQSQALARMKEERLPPANIQRCVDRTARSHRGISQ